MFRLPAATGVGVGVGAEPLPRPAQAEISNEKDNTQQLPARRESDMGTPGPQAIGGADEGLNLSNVIAAAGSGLPNQQDEKISL